MSTETPQAASSAGVRRRALWSLVAQGLASANGLVTAILAARSMPTVEFGLFAALMTLTVMLVGMVSAFLSQPLLLTRGGDSEITAQARSTLLAALATGALLGVGLAVASLVFDDVRTGLLVLAVSFPLVVVCDAFRYIATFLGHAGKAALADALRLVLFIGLYGVLYAGSRQDANSLTVLWCGCAVVVGTYAVVAGLRLTRRSPVDLRQFTRVKFLGYQFSLEYFIGIFGNAVPTLSLGWFVSVEAIGHFRGVSTLFGPILVLATSAVIVMAPYLVRRTPAERTPILIGMAAVFNGATLLWMAILLWIPDSVGRELLGDAWAGSSELIVPAALQMVGIGLLTTAQTGIRVARPRMSFMMNVCAVIASGGSFLIGVLIDGLHGALWGFGVGAFLAAAIGIAIYVRVKDTPEPEAEDARVEGALQ